MRLRKLKVAGWQPKRGKAVHDAEYALKLKRDILQNKLEEPKAIVIC